MIFYLYKSNILCSMNDEYDYEKINFNEIKNNETLFYLLKIKGDNTKRVFSVEEPEDFFIENEDHNLMKKKDVNNKESLIELLDRFHIKGINTTYENFENEIYIKEFSKKRLNLLALGDVGSTLLIGLRIMGSDILSEIGICDINKDMGKRWSMELNQITSPLGYDDFPYVKTVEMEDLFNCDIFVFCASMGVPKVGEKVKDVRMAQLEKNVKLISQYSQLASKSDFKGIFAVVSDPVDPLCQAVLENSDLKPEQIKGYGLGVMNGRASYYSKKDKRFSDYVKEGRAYGPHGEDLIIANSIEHYDNELSLELTQLAINANLKVRELGFKPYVAPALSSGSFSILETLRENYNYSSVSFNGKFFGCKNKLTRYGAKIERINMPIELENRIKTVFYKK